MSNENPQGEGTLLVNCKKCGPQPATNFYTDKNSKSGYRSYCKPCGLRSTLEWKLKNRAAKEKRKRLGGPIVAIGDIHFPWHHEGWLAWVLDIIKETQPSLVVQVGDLYDLFAFSKYPRSHNVMLPSEELAEARACAEDMWSEIRNVNPQAELIQLKGNHDDRIEKRMIEHLPEMESLLMPTLQALWAFDGVKTINDSREEVERQGVLFHHGHKKFGTHFTFNNMSTVNGHTHTGGVVLKQTADGVIWELNAGCGIDVRAPVFGYTAQKRMSSVTLGLGFIDQYGPRFMTYQERR